LRRLQADPPATPAGFFVLYVAVAALSLPGAAIMTLAAGALFGLVQGTLLVSFASSLGATLAFLASRFPLHDLVQRRFGSYLASIYDGIRRDGALYLFGLRLVPAFPFFAINLVMGLTPIRTVTFYWVSQVGMLAGTVVFVNAGTQLANIDSLSGLLSPALIASFAALGLFPLAARKTLKWFQQRRAPGEFESQRFVRPRHFDRDLVVIGAGSGGLVSAHIAAAVKAKVTLIVAHRMGGDCLRHGLGMNKLLSNVYPTWSEANKYARRRCACPIGCWPGSPTIMPGDATNVALCTTRLAASNGGFAARGRLQGIDRPTTSAPALRCGC
jgi:uncharacterized membrane protein YdjX (TVP38/TMEM64 family)